ncbi:MAG: LON peptidase substrate-binding domain-containing protein [Pyrinomonadaceae bacterium]
MSKKHKPPDSEKIIPLFPLPLVLLPFETVPLHIFEERYRQMVSDVIADDSPFGILGIEENSIFDEENAIGLIGCAAQIAEYKPLENGRSNIAVTGAIRFEIEDILQTPNLYTTVKVRYFDDDAPKNSASLEALNVEVSGLFYRIANAAYKLDIRTSFAPEIPKSEPEVLSFLVCAALNLPTETKSRMLFLRDTATRLEFVKAELQKLLPEMEEKASNADKAKTNGHFKHYSKD